MKVVLTAAIMDMCHEGHINLLKQMRQAGDRVIVVLHDDRSCYLIKNKIPIQNIKQRCENLMITNLVDEVLITKQTDPADKFAEVIAKYNDILFMRADDNLDFPGKWLIDEKNIPIKFVPYTKGVSSTWLRKLLCKFSFC
jgi:cytidyltransferase-like protein